MQISKLLCHREDTPEELHRLLNSLGGEYPVTEGGRGLRLKFRKMRGDGILSRTIRSKGEVTVEYNCTAGAARGVGSAFSGVTGEERTPFETLGIMLDVSRAMVMTVEHFKMWLRRLALSGCNLVMLYCEDIYELEDEPFFGFMRGGYSLEELREIDDYASGLGIEMIGCIQTLGHMEQTLKWKCAYEQVTDTARVMMVDAPETRRLIEKMLDFWSQALHSRRIHIGMDETHDLGRGRFLDYNGYERGFDLFNRHLGLMEKLCAARGLKPMIWSDMYFRLANPKHTYYDFTSPIPADVKAAIPKQIQLVYWDYYHEDVESYRKMIRRHREDLGFDPVMGSGIWTWSRLWYDHGKTMRTARPCIEACRQEKVRELFFTMWGDDGAFCNYDSSLAGISSCCDLAFGVDDAEYSEARFESLFSSSYAAHLAAGSMYSRLENTRDGGEFEVMAHLLLWDDPLYGIAFDDYKRRNPEFDLNLLDICEESLCEVLPHVEECAAGDLEHAANTLKLLLRKLELRGALEAAYDSGDRIALRELATVTVPETIAAARNFYATYRRQWLECAKPFGMEMAQ
ncbi:MAG: family 20 glycosylhydrolase, partial [Lentisphaeria bacterium]|nr:family 20 glycosylhydrolase [Lentisphaeria bacterium]